MADYGSSLPVETLVPGDVDVSIYDSTGTNAWDIDSNGIGMVNLNDGTNALVISASGGVAISIPSGEEIQITDGTETLLVNTDGSLSSQITDGTNALDINTDGSVTAQISDGTDALDINSDGSINVVVTAGGTITGEIHEFGQSASVASGATADVVDYIVTATKTLLLTSFQAASSGKAKVELKAGTDGAETVRAVAFISTASGFVEMTFPYAIEVAAGDSILVTVTNNEPGQAVDLYGYINGREA